MQSMSDDWSDPGRFYGAPISTVDAPIVYGRMIADAFKDSKDLQYDFLCSIDHERLLEIQRMTGTYQGENPVHRNQLLDAWHLGCAEQSNCDFFLSLDFGLARIVLQSKRPATVPIVRPTELLNAID